MLQLLTEDRKASDSCRRTETENVIFFIYIYMFINFPKGKTRPYDVTNRQTDKQTFGSQTH